VGLKNYFKPGFRFSGAAHEKLNAQAIHIELIDNPGYASDSIRILASVDSHDDIRIEKGDTVGFQQGYLDAPSLYDMGRFKVTAINPLYFPSRLEIEATADALHFNQPAKLRRSQSYISKTLADIVGEISARLNLEPKVHQRFRDNVIVYIDQKNESDMSFLQRLAKRYDAIAKTYDGHLIFAPRGVVSAASGRDFEPVELVVPTPNQKAVINGLKSLNLRSSEREIASGVKADYYDLNLADIRSVTVGTAPYIQLPGRFADETTARDFANSELSRIKRQSLKFDFSLPGNPELMTDRLVNISGASDRVNGLSSCDVVRHVHTPGSFTTFVEASAAVK